MAKKNGLPRVEKTVSAFLSDETGRISKGSIVRIGSIVGSIAVASLLSGLIPCAGASHGNHGDHSSTTSTISGGYDDTKCAIKAEHTFHHHST